mgnify:CR=1 FL=1
MTNPEQAAGGTSIFHVEIVNFSMPECQDVIRLIDAKRVLKQDAAIRQEPLLQLAS